MTPTPHGQVPEALTGDKLREIARSARTSASDSASPEEYVLAGWRAAMSKAPSIDDLCARIKAADDAAADRDYMLDSNDCIDVLRGQWKGPMAMDKPERAPHGQAPAGATNTKTHELLSTTVGLLMGYREGAARQPYKPGSVIDKTVAEAVEHLKDWPYPEPTPATQQAGDLARLLKEILADACHYESETNLRAELYQRLYDAHAALTATPQPTPHPPQADSAQDEPLQAFDSPRAKALMRAWEEGWAACRDAEYVGEEAQNDAFNSSHTLTLCIAEDQQLTAPQADSQPAPEYVGNGMFKGETIEKAAEHWANWCDHRCMTGLSEFLRVVAARAPADSVLEDAALLKEARDALWQPANVALCERIDAYLNAARKQGANHD